MSHFCLGVICRNGTESEIEKLLKPFSENSDEFLKFHSITEEYKEKYERDDEVYKKLKRFWELVVEEQPLKEGEKEPMSWYSKNFYTENYESKYEYADKESRFKTFALLTPDGVWLERGKVLWFGIDTRNKESNNDFEKAFKEIVEDPKYQDFYLVLVDCHI